MPVHNVGGEEVVVSPKSRNYYVYRRQGVAVEVSPDRHWWCAWLCSSTKKIDFIECSITLTGLSEATATDSCEDCGKLSVMGPTFWGVNIPQPFDLVAYRGTVRIEGEVFPISGSMQY